MGDPCRRFEMTPRRSSQRASTCLDCLAWGVLGARRCAACAAWRHNHSVERRCAGCQRELAVKDEHCRLCWQQARLEAKLVGGLKRGAVTVLQAGNLEHHQLFFDRMKGRRSRSPPRRYDRRGAPTKPAPAPVVRPGLGWMQPGLFETRRDFTCFNERTDPDLNNPWLTWAIYLAHRRGEARGWARGTRSDVRRALIIVLSRHTDGDKVYYRDIFPALRALSISVERVGEVLDEMGVLVDDRRPSFDVWLDRKLDGLAPHISDAVEIWLRTMHEGGPRSRAYDIASVQNRMNNARPTLLDWSMRYDHLREVTSDDIETVLAELHGSRRANVLSSLRSLFAFALKRQTIFRNPTRGIKVGQRPYRIIQPLDQADIDRAVAAANTPVARLALVLAAIHAARTSTIASLRLDDVDLGNRRLTLAGRVHPIDKLTHQILTEWLDYRRTRWPQTANPHLIINQMSANGIGPASTIYFAKTALRGQTATLERLRVDRQLQEALADRPDPLHLAAVFGLDPKTAIRYAENAAQLLQTTAEEQNPASSREPKGPNHP